MKKKLLSVFLCAAMAASLLVGCGNAASTGSESTGSAGGSGGKVGVAMPTKDLQRWNQDGANMEQQLKAAGYDVDLQYASNDIATQVSQIENMISSGAHLALRFL